jgi:ribosomal protein S18 acetylase RimI-like enzyme
LVSIRQFIFPDEYQAVISLWSQVGPGVQVRRSDQFDEIAKKVERDPDLFLVAEDAGRIIGAVMGGFDGRRGMVYHLAVERAYRRQGIGVSLMKELENRLQAKGCIKYYLLVTRDNGAAIQFYEDMGCELMDLFVFGKDLV